MNAALGANGESATLISKALSGAPDDLTEPEFARVGFLLRATCMHLEAEYFLYQNGAMEEELWRKHLSLRGR